MLYWEDLKNQKAYLQETSVARALFFKRAIATAAVLAALSWEAKEPAPVNNFNTNNIEVVEQANTVSYEVEEVTQSNNYYNYIKNIMPSVNKYFPKYSSYFRNVLNKLNGYGTAEKYLINKRINKTIKNYWEFWSITTEKDKTATALIVFDYLEWDSEFIKDKNIVHKDSNWNEDIRIEATNDILKAINREYNSILNDRKKFENESKKIGELIKSWNMKESNTEIINYYEKTMRKFKEYFIDAWLLKESKNAQIRFEWYIKILKREKKQPSELGKLYINEYNKIM